jgi:hypothetical protein
MMWEFEENPIMIEEVGVEITNFSKKVLVKRGIILKRVLLEY